jgi:hypothetical protein
MHESVELADDVLQGLESGRDVEESAKNAEPKVVVEQVDKTAVMTKPPVARPQPKDTIKMGPPSVMIDESGSGEPEYVVNEDETTRRNTPPHPQRVPRHTGNQQKTVLDRNNPYMNQAPAPQAPAENGPAPSMMPAWVTPPVMVLAPLTVALAVALIIVQCGSRSDDARGSRTTQAGADPSASAAVAIAALATASQQATAPSPLALPTTPPVAVPPPEPTQTQTPASTVTAAAPAATTGSTARPSSPPPAKPTSNAGRPAIDRAREAALEGKPGDVRAILEAKVRGGHGSVEEARLLRAACKQMGDTACAEDVLQKYPLHFRD